MGKNKYISLEKLGLILLLAIPLSIMLYPSEGKCSKGVNIVVKTIHASRDKNSVDPRLKNLVQELNSVFRYLSYEFLGQKNLNLTKNKKAVVQLPEGRTMNITSRGVDGDRVTLQIEIFKRKNKIFQTVIKLRNNASITIGGPGYKGGNLLFNIFTSF